MVPQAIRMAEKAFKRYRTRNPFEIIEARKIKLMEYDQPKTLLGFYTVMNRTQVIGINNAADEVQRRTGAIQELGHSLNDYKLAVSGNCFNIGFLFIVQKSKEAFKNSFPHTNAYPYHRICIVVYN